MTSGRTQTAAGADIIRMPKHLRMDWVDVMALDPSVSHSEFRVASVIGTHIGNKSGRTYVSLETLAAVTGLSKSTVKRAAIRLEALGYLIIERRQIGVRADGSRAFGGKGVANEYLPAGNAVQLSATDRGLLLVAKAREFWDRADTAKRVMGDPLTASKRITGDPLWQTHRGSNDDSKRVMGEPPTLASPEGKNSSRAHASALAIAIYGQPGGEEDEPLGLAGRLLRKRLGEEKFAAWFRNLQLVQCEPPVLTLQAPTKFIRNWVLTNFLDVALDCWRAETPNIERIEIIVAGERGGSG